MTFSGTNTLSSGDVEQLLPVSLHADTDDTKVNHTQQVALTATDDDTMYMYGPKTSTVNLGSANSHSDDELTTKLEETPDQVKPKTSSISDFSSPLTEHGNMYIYN